MGGGRLEVDATVCALRHPHDPRTWLLRYVLFGEVAREGMMTAERIRVSLLDLSMHLKRMAFGEPGVAMSGVRALLIVGGVLVGLIALAARSRARDSARLMRVAVYFLLVWIALGAAPTLVAGYASPRHMYLASAGWAIALAIGLDALWQAGPRWLRSVATVAAAAVLAGYAIQLRAVVRDWSMRAAVSQQAVADVEREALAAPSGSLVIAGAPRASWEFALPHALRPPFTQVDLTSRVSVISRSSLHCCSASQWEEYTRRTLRAWLARDDRPPVIALAPDPRSGNRVAAHRSRRALPASADGRAGWHRRPGCTRRSDPRHAGATGCHARSGHPVTAARKRRAREPQRPRREDVPSGESAAGVRWRAALLALAVVVTYANGLSGPFVLDDQASIVQNPQIRDRRAWQTC